MLNGHAGEYIYNTPLDEIFDLNVEGQWMMHLGDLVHTQWAQGHQCANDRLKVVRIYGRQAGQT